MQEHAFHNLGVTRVQIDVDGTVVVGVAVMGIVGVAVVGGAARVGVAVAGGTSVGVAVLECVDADQVDEEAEDGDDEQAFVFHLKLTESTEFYIHE